MKHLIVVLFFVSSFHFYGQDVENTAKHIGTGIVIGGVGGYAAHKIFNGQRGWTWAGAVGSSLAAGLAKETYDTSTAGIWETDDVLYTTLGGVISGLAMELLVNKSKRSGRGGLRKNCGCLVMNTTSGHFNYVPLAVENSSRSITSELQVSYWLE